LSTILDSARMFTGIIQAVGKVRAIEQRAQQMRLSLDAGKLSLADVKLGDSIAVSVRV
jgi:riboflavin synthase